MRKMILPLLLLTLAAAPLAAQDKGPVFSRKVYIGADAATAWDALVNPKVVKQYHLAPLGGIELKKDGEIWYGADDKKVIAGKILEIDAGKKLVHSFQFAHRKDEPSRVTYEIEAMDAMCALKLTHDQFASETETYADISEGWDVILSNLKTLLETGDVLPWPESDGPRAPADLSKAQIIELPSEEELPGQFETFKLDTTGAGDHGWGNDVERGEVAVQRGYGLSFNCSDKITNAQFGMLKSVPRLMRLNISYAAEINDRGMRAFAGMVDLRILFLNGLKISDQGLRSFSGLKNLEILQITSCGTVSGVCLKSLPAPEKLRQVTFTWMEITDETFEALGKCTKLRKFRCTESRAVTDAGIAHLKNLAELDLLALPGGSKITDLGLKHLAGLSALASLEIRSLEGLAGEGFESIGKLAALKTLEIYGCPNLVSPGENALAKLTSLERVSFSACPKLNDDLMVALGKCTQVTQLSLVELAVTDKGLAQLAPLTKLNALWITRLELTDAATKAIAELKSVADLWLDYCQGITDAGVKELAALKNLRELSFRGSETLTDACLDEFKNFPALTSLTLYYCKKITKEGVEKLRTAKPKLWVSFD